MSPLVPLPKGTNYPGSELGYIKNADVSVYKFGQGYYEADAGDTYTFRYTYGNGDYYDGKVYRDPMSATYYPGYKLNSANELVKTGYYEIKAVSFAGWPAPSMARSSSPNTTMATPPKKPLPRLMPTTPKGTILFKERTGLYQERQRQCL